MIGLYGLMTPFNYGGLADYLRRYRNLRQTRSGQEPSGLKSSSGMSLNVNCGGVGSLPFLLCPQSSRKYRYICGSTSPSMSVSLFG